MSNQKYVFGGTKKVAKKRSNSASNLLTNQIIKLIQWKFGDAWRIQKGQVKTQTGQLRPVNMENGLPDLIACINGRYVGIEVKIGKDRMSDYQKHQQERTIKADGIYFIARTYEQTETFLNETFKCKT